MSHVEWLETLLEAQRLVEEEEEDGAEDEDEPPELVDGSESEDSDDDDEFGDEFGENRPTKRGAIAADVAAAVKAAADERLAWMKKEWTVAEAGDALVSLWTEPGFSHKSELAQKQIQLSLITAVSDAMMRKTGSHVQVARAYRDAFKRRFGDHLDAERIDRLPGLSDEVRAKCKDICENGVSAEEEAPRWNLRHKMDTQVAEEHGAEAVDKAIKDGVEGRLLLFTSSVLGLLSVDEYKVMLCKLIRVAKRDLKGYTIDAEGRFCHAQLEANELTPSLGIGVGGKVRLPVPRHVLDDAMYLAGVYPGRPVLAAKADVSGAFKLLWLVLHLIGLFATAIPMWTVGLGLHDFIAINLVLTFGSTVSPGNYDFFSKAIEMAHRAYGPPAPRRDGNSRFRSHTLVDDGVIVAVLLGFGLRYSMATYRHSMMMALGASAVNVEKFYEEGAFAATVIAWGIIVNMSQLHLGTMKATMEMTASKKAKATALVFDPMFDSGSFAFGEWQARVLAGNIVFWANVCPAMWSLLMRVSGAISSLPKGKRGLDREPTAEELQAYEQVWNTVELLRVIVSSPRCWASATNASYASLLTLRERLSMRDAHDNLVWTGGDANLHGCAMGSWTDGVYDVLETKVWEPRLRAWMDATCPGYDQRVFVAVWELLCFIAVASHCAPRWAGKIVLEVTDNQNVEAWLANVRAGNPVANHLLLLLVLLMIRYDFTVYAFYINTHSNPWDLPSRIHDPPSELKSDGFGPEGLDEFMKEWFPDMQRVDMQDSMAFYLERGGMDSILEIFGEEDPVARNLAEQRRKSAETNVRMPAQGIVAVDLLAGSGTCSMHLTRLGGAIRAYVEWHPAARALYRLALGEVPHVADFWSEDIKAIPAEGVEAAMATPNCQPFSTASGNARGLDDPRGWMLPRVPAKLASFRWLLASILENVWGAVGANGGKVWMLYIVGMKHIDHFVFPAEQVHAPDLGSRISSTRLIAHSERTIVADSLGALPRLAGVLRPAGSILSALLPVEVVRERLRECEIYVDVASIRWAESVMPNSRRPTRLGTYINTGKDAKGEVTRGAKVTLCGSSDTTAFRVDNKFADGRLELWAPGRRLCCAQLDVVVHPYEEIIYSIRSVGLRCTVIGERPAGPGKACYWDDRFRPPVLRALLGEECNMGVGKPASWLRSWESRAAEEAADPSASRTVPPYLEELKFMLAGNSLEWNTSGAAVERLVGRIAQFKAGVTEGLWEMPEPTDGSEPELPTEFAEQMARVLGSRRSAEPSNDYGIDDKHLQIKAAATSAETSMVGDERWNRAWDDGLILRDDAFLGRGQAAVELGLVPPRGELLGGVDDAEPAEELGEREESRYELDQRVEYFGPLGAGSGLLGMDAVATEGAGQSRPRRERKQRTIFTTDGRATQGRGKVWRDAPQLPDRQPAADSSDEEDEPPPLVDASDDSDDDDPDDGKTMREASKAGARTKTATGTASGRATSATVARPSSNARTSTARAGARTGARATRTRTARARPRSSKRSAGAPSEPTAAARRRPDATKSSKRRKKDARTGEGKTRHRDGFNLLGLEARAAIASGDWAAFERLTTSRLPLYSVAWGTLKSYEPGWRQWVSFCDLRDVSPFLQVETTAERRRAAHLLLLFVGICRFQMNERASTIKGKLMAIRFFHLAFEMDNPIDKVPRVWMAYRAIKRAETPTERKHPVTPAMCEWLDDAQRSWGLEGVTRRAARYFGVLLCARCSEYLAPIDDDKILLVRDVMPMKGKQYADWGDEGIDGCMIRFRGSKTDKYNEGCLRYVGVTDNGRCFVKAVLQWYELDPEHFEDDVARPMFRLPSGKTFTREAMQQDLRDAATALKIDAQRYGTHSLRIAGATWMYQVGKDIEVIKRHGRWTSNVVHVYLWEGSGHASLAKDMANVDFALHVHMPSRAA